MTETTTTRPLPVDVGTLKAYLPPEPADTSVTRARLTVANLDAAIATVRAELGDAEGREKATATELYEAANRGDDLGPILTAWRPARAHAEQRLAVLDAARNIAHHKLAVAEREDPIVALWRQRCAAITSEWQIAQSADSPEQRFANIVAFAEHH